MLCCLYALASKHARDWPDLMLVIGASVQKAISYCEFWPHLISSSDFARAQRQASVLMVGMRMLRQKKSWQVQLYYRCVRLARTVYIHRICTVYLKISLRKNVYTPYIYGSGQPYHCAFDLIVCNCTRTRRQASVLMIVMRLLRQSWQVQLYYCCVLCF